jgi:hypothetical protein
VTHPSEEERRATAENAAVTLRLKRLASLSIALMRGDAAVEKGSEAMSAVWARRLSDEYLVAEVMESARVVRNNDVSTAFGMLALHLATLYAVAEKWKAWGFSDPAVDQLLTSPHLGVLRKYRHTVFHVDLLDAPGAAELSARQEVVDWSKELAAAFRAALVAAWSNVPPWPKE